MSTRSLDATAGFVAVGVGAVVGWLIDWGHGLAAGLALGAWALGAGARRREALLLLAGSSLAAGWLIALIWAPPPVPPPPPWEAAVLERAEFSPDGRWLLRCDRYPDGERLLAQLDLTKPLGDRAAPEDVVWLGWNEFWTATREGSRRASVFDAEAIAFADGRTVSIVGDGRLEIADDDSEGPPRWLQLDGGTRLGRTRRWLTVRGGRVATFEHNEIGSQAPPTVVSVWDIDRLERIRRLALDWRVRAAALGERVLLAADSRQLTLWPLPDGPPTVVPMIGVQAIDVAPAPHGDFAAIALSSGELLRIRLPEPGQPLRVIERRADGRPAGPQRRSTPALRMLDDRVILAMRPDGLVTRSDGPDGLEILPLRYEPPRLLPEELRAPIVWTPNRAPPPRASRVTLRVASAAAARLLLIAAIVYLGLLIGTAVHSTRGGWSELDLPWLLLLCGISVFTFLKDPPDGRPPVPTYVSTIRALALVTYLHAGLLAGLLSGWRRAHWAWLLAVIWTAVYLAGWRPMASRSSPVVAGAVYLDVVVRLWLVLIALARLYTAAMVRLFPRTSAGD